MHHDVGRLARGAREEGEEVLADRLNGHQTRWRQQSSPAGLGPSICRRRDHQSLTTRSTGVENAAESAALAGALSGTAAPPEYGAPARASRASPKRQARVASCGTTRPAHCAQAALRLAPAERAAVDELRPLGEAAVGRGGAVRAADQPARVLRGDPVHGVALDHRPLSTSESPTERARCEVLGAFHAGKT